MRFIFVMLVVMLVGGCSEYDSDMRVVWSTSVQNHDDPYGDSWEEREIAEPVKCRDEETFYLDPYTKFEYCLPEDFQNIRNLNAYRVK